MSDTVNLIDFYNYNKFSTEQACRDYLQKARWGDEIVCPKCGTIGEAYKYSDGRLFKCGACRKQFTVRVGTIFEDSKLPLQKWFLAIYLATSLKKGISSIQLSKYLGITQKTAWFVLHRVRYAVEQGGGFDKPLDGNVEMDETYIGGRRKLAHKFDNKSGVFGVERNGRAMVSHVKSSGARVLLPAIQSGIATTAEVFSDEWQTYKTLPKLGYSHTTVNHSKLEYVRGTAHTNTIEGFWSHLKRGVDGIYHHVSPKHLQMYCSEYEYRYNTREMTDFERFTDWFRSSRCRLTYKELING